MKEISTRRGLKVKVDDNLFELLDKYKWHISVCEKTKFYAQTTFKGKLSLTMHDFLMNTPKGMTIDHVNGDSLDNRMDNLRICSQQQNNCNRKSPNVKKTSKFKGVYWHSQNNCWIAQCKRIHLGRFATQELAAKAYDIAAKEQFGDYACTNFQ